MENKVTRYFNKHFAIAIVALLTSCATAMTPKMVNETLPSLTKSQYITSLQANQAVKSKRCKYITKGRSYRAPRGITNKHDLMNGAKGIDEWVEIDGGNAYVLKSFKWIRVDESGATQLDLEFDTMICK